MTLCVFVPLWLLFTAKQEIMRICFFYHQGTKDTKENAKAFYCNQSAHKNNIRL
jgi:hypothetical protein